MKRLVVLISMLVMLTGCAATKQEFPKLFGDEELTSGDVAEFALEVGVGMALWSVGLPDLNGDPPPDFDLGD